MIEVLPAHFGRLQFISVFECYVAGSRNPIISFDDSIHIGFPRKEIPFDEKLPRSFAFLYANEHFVQQSSCFISLYPVTKKIGIAVAHIKGFRGSWEFASLSCDAEDFLKALKNVKVINCLPALKVLLCEMGYGTFHNTFKIALEAAPFAHMDELLQNENLAKPRPKKPKYDPLKDRHQLRFNF